MRRRNEVPYEHASPWIFFVWVDDFDGPTIVTISSGSHLLGHLYLGTCPNKRGIEFDKVMPSCLASFSREKNRNHLSQPEADQNNLKWPGRINGWHRHWEDAMQHPKQRDPETTISRRTLVHGLAVCAGATVAGASAALAQGPRPTPGRPRGAAVDDHQPAARFQSARRPDHLFLGPRHHRGRSVLQRPRPAQHGDQASLYRGIVGRRSGLERAGPLSPVERHSQQQADAIFRG